MLHGLGEIAYRTLNMTKWAAMCKITGEEMWWIRMDLSKVNEPLVVPTSVG